MKKEVRYYIIFYIYIYIYIYIYAKDTFFGRLFYQKFRHIAYIFRD